MAVMQNKIVFGTVDSSTYGIYVSGEGVFNASKRDVEMVAIPGRNGALILDKGRFENITVTYPAFTYETSMATFQQNLANFRNALSAQKGYQRLTDSFHTDEYRIAAFVDGIKINPIKYNTASEFDIIFDCKPQRYLTSGEVPQTRTPTQGYTDATTVTDNMVSFNATENVGISKIVAKIEAVQSGTGEPAPDNVRPISGWSSVNINRAGKNLLPLRAAGTTVATNGLTWTWLSDGTITLDGTASVNVGMPLTSSDSDNNKVYLPAGTYIVSGAEDIDDANTYVGININSTSGSYAATSKGTATFTVADGDYIYPRFRISQGVTFNHYVLKPMVCLASDTDAAFDPYVGNTYTISLGQTVYGGSLDVTTGVLTVTHGFATFIGDNAEGWGMSGTGRRFYTDTLNSVIKKATANGTAVANDYCNRFSVITANQSWDGGVIGYAVDTNGRLYIRLQTDAESATTLADFKTWLSSNNVQFCYELATPTTVNLTATQIDTLLGLNQVWANSGDVTVIYGTNPFYVVNPTLFDSEPLIAITNSGTVQINDVTITSTAAANETIYIDCESKEIYYYVGGSLANASSLISFSGTDFPKLKPGRNKLLLSGIASVVITPRWWRI